MGAKVSYLTMVLMVVAAAVPACATGRAEAAGYTISRTADGLQLTVHFERHSYPAQALIAVTARLRNLSHRHLAVAHPVYPYGLCNWPVISIVAVDAKGQYAEPLPPIPRPAPPCPAPREYTLPIGQSIGEHQLIVLWTPRLRITAQISNFVHNCYCGFEFPALSAHFHLYPAPAPQISVQNQAGSTVAVVSPPRGVRGPFYYQSWGSCAISGAYYWTARRVRTVSAGCANPAQWHLDVDWLNMPVAALNLRH